MTGTIIRMSDFVSVVSVPINNYTLPIGSASGAAGKATVPRHLQDYSGYWLYVNDQIYLITKCSPGRGNTTLTIKDPIEVFNRNVIYTGPADTVGGFIDQTITSEYILQADSVYALRYIAVSNSDTTPFVAPATDEYDIYNLADYIRTAMRSGVKIEFAQSDTQLSIAISTRHPASGFLPFRDGHSQFGSATYSSDAVAKVTVRQQFVTASTIAAAVDWALGIAQDNRHGYDQIYRWGPDYDCSSLVITAWQQAGVPVRDAGASYTGNMRTRFIQCGFEDVTDSVNLSSGSGLRYGDVLLRHDYNPESGHCALYVGDGLIVHAAANESGGATGGQTGDQTGGEICTRGYYNSPWYFVLRYSLDEGGTETFVDHIYYLAADGSISTTVPSVRAKGTWQIKTCGEDEDPLVVAAETFEKNKYSHKIQFSAERRLALYDRVTLVIESEIVESDITEITLSSGSSWYQYTCGDLPVTLEDKLRTALKKGG